MLKNKSTNSVFLLFCLFSVGLFNEYLSCIASALILIRLIYIVLRQKSFSFRLNWVLLTVCVIVFTNLLSLFWAVDRGTAIIGFLKYLPVLLFLIMAQQGENAEDFTAVLPIGAVIMTCISAPLSFIPKLSAYFTVAGRLSGFFQYSNTYALFALISLIVLLSGGMKKIYEWFFAAVILFGILYSGSRTVFIIMLIAVPAAVIVSRNKKLIITSCALLTVGILGAVIYAFATDNFAGIGRFLTLSLKESTFLGRLLYYKDALPIILKHPFGLGFMGYYYMQQSFQTGVYSVMYVHNDFLQIMLDIGWIPAALLIFTVVRSFFKKGAGAVRRIIILTFCAHSCFDFNFAFAAMFLLFILLLDWNSGRKVTVNSIAPVITAGTVLTLVSVYFGTALFLSYIKRDETALKLYPFNTVSQLRLLTAAESTDDMYETAEDIIGRNKYISACYSAISKYYYSQGDFQKVMEYKRLTLDCAPYSTEEYNEYAYMLIMGIQLYERAGDSVSANYCRYELLDIPERLNRVKEKTDKIGYLIKDKPDLSLKEEINDYISKTSVSMEEQK